MYKMMWYKKKLIEGNKEEMGDEREKRLWKIEDMNK